MIKKALEHIKITCRKMNTAATVFHLMNWREFFFNSNRYCRLCCWRQRFLHCIFPLVAERVASANSEIKVSGNPCMGRVCIHIVQNLAIQATWNHFLGEKRQYLFTSTLYRIVNEFLFSLVRSITCLVFSHVISCLFAFLCAIYCVPPANYFIVYMDFHVDI